MRLVNEDFIETNKTWIVMTHDITPTTDDQKLHTSLLPSYIYNSYDITQ